jgi:hypothetical protein
MSPIYIALSLLCGDQKSQNLPSVKYWEIIADNLSKAGWSWGCVSAIDSSGRTRACTKLAPASAVLVSTST